VVFSDNIVELIAIRNSQIYLASSTTNYSTLLTGLIT